VNCPKINLINFLLTKYNNHKWISFTVNFSFISTLRIRDQALVLLTRTSCGWSFTQTTWPEYAKVQKLYVGTFCEYCVCSEHSYHDNPQNMQCSFNLLLHWFA